ncbi:MAG: SAM-dependent methyltransferase [Paracoccaceae bacterium]
MSDLVKISDPRRLAHNRARARKMGPDLFLHRAAADEIKERLNEVNRRFTKPALIAEFPEIWQEALQDRLSAARILPPAEILALEPGAHDLVIHAMALHWADDPVGQLIQCRHALRPDGLLLAVLPGGQSLQELRSALAEAETALYGGLSLRVLPMAEIRSLGNLLARAGLALPVADTLSLAASYRDIRHLARDLRAMGEGNALASRPRPATRPLFDLAGQIYAQNFPMDDGRIKATFDLIFLTGWAPDESQQQPLRPGSAQMRLADVLGQNNQGTPDE